MPTILGRLLIAAVLLAGAFYASGEATRLDATADAWHQLVSLGNDVAPPPPPARWTTWLPAVLRPTHVVSDRQRASAEYWLSRYEGLVRASGADPDPAVMLTAANAAFRVARQTGEVGAVGAKQLDAVLEALEASYMVLVKGSRSVGMDRVVTALERRHGARRAELP